MKFEPCEVRSSLRERGCTVRFALLGPLVMFDDAQAPVPLAGVRQRVLLAALLIHANHPVSADTLVETIWNGERPSEPGMILRSAVRRLRGAIGAGPAARIVACPPGYLIRVEESELDTAQFETQCRRAGAALHRGDWASASAAAAQALELWRGAPLLDVPSPALREKLVPRFEQLRLQALEDRIEADLHLGRHDRLALELRDLTAAHPLRERFHAQLILALARTGRQAEALEAYRDARGVLVEELGIEPGPELRELHERVLSGDADLITPPTGAASRPAPSAEAVPRQLPAAVAHFAGRAELIKALTGQSAAAGRDGSAVAISAIAGTAGVGKTALAVHWSHHNFEHYPDGQLYVNLHGFDISGRPTTPAEAMRGFLDALGTPVERVPSGLEAQAGLYRSLLSDKRMLIVLDNARDADQVRPLLPGAAGCRVLITSRNQLTDLIALDGAIPLTVDLLTVREAGELLANRLGAERVIRERQAADELVELCARLPLALNIAAARAATRSGTALGTLADELRDVRRRLDVLSAGQGTADLRAVFSWSYQTLGGPAARMFRLLGLHPGPDFSEWAAARLADLDQRQARRALDELTAAHLLTEDVPGRYTFHDLLRAYAYELVIAEHREEERTAALTALFDYYLHTAACAMDVRFPAEIDRRPRIPAPADPPPPIMDGPAAQTWLDAERANLVAVAAHAADGGWPEHATRMSVTLFRYLDSGGHFPEAAVIHGSAVRAAAQTGDHAGEAHAVINLGGVHMRHGDFQQAAEHYQRALTLCRRSADRFGELRVLGSLAVIDQRQGRLEQAEDHFRQVLSLSRELGAASQEIRALSCLGQVALFQGGYPQAARHFQQALDLCGQTGDQTCRADALIGIAEVDLRQGRYREARDCLDEARVACRETGNRASDAQAVELLGVVELREGHYEQAKDRLCEALNLFREDDDVASEAGALRHLAEVDLSRGRYQQAGDGLRRSLARCLETGDRAGEAHALNLLGDASLLTGDPDRARTRYADALTLTGQITDRHQRAHALDGLGKTFASIGDAGQARRHWQEALDLYTALGAPEADQVRVRLSAME